MPQLACDHPAIKGWLLSDHDTTTMGTPEFKGVFDLLYDFRDEVSCVIRVHMPSGMDPQYPYGQADTEASLSQVLTDQWALALRARELWRRDAVGQGSPPGKLLPSCSTSGMWTLKCPPPPWRICPML